ncbi:MAG TPA: DUF2141 domain-containing protein [Novosphingobium sp.]
MRHGPRIVGGLCGAFLLTGATVATPEGDVSATVIDLRSSKGEVLACLTTRPDAFPDCNRDPKARTLRMSAARSVVLDFGPVPAGRYAISLFHDENGNGRLDKRLMIPREGYGFSRNAPVMMGPPRFASAVFAVDAAGHHETIKMRYIF